MITKNVITAFTLLAACQCLHLISHASICSTLPFMELLRFLTTVVMFLSFVLCIIFAALLGNIAQQKLELPRTSYREDLMHESITFVCLAFLILPTLIFCGLDTPENVHYTGKDIIIALLIGWTVVSNLELRFQFSEE